MAYALTYEDQRNPFSVAEYRTFSIRPAPLNRSTIWLMYAEEPRAYVGMAIWPTLLHHVSYQPDFAIDRDNAAFAYLAVGGAVFFMRLFPETMPTEAVEVFEPDEFGRGGVRRIWPTPRRQFFPLETVSNADMAAIFEFPEAVAEAVGLPVQGQNDDDIADIISEYRAGHLPNELRKRWIHDT